MWLYEAAGFLVAAGMSLGFALLWLRNGMRRRRHVLDELLALRKVLEQDPLAGLSASGALILRLGLRGMRWQGQWYGAPVQGAVGDGAQSLAGALSHDFAQADVQLNLRVSLRGLRGEARLFAEQSAQMLFAIFEGALAARELALVSSMAQRARVAVFVQHDMRNLAQWVALVADDMDQAQTPAEIVRSVQRLREGASLARDRAQRISAALLRPDSGAGQAERWQPLDVLDDLAQAAAMHQVVLQIEPGPAGGLTLDWSASAWAAVLDNLLGNASRLSRERVGSARCKVRIAHTGQMLEISFETPDLPLEVPLPRLFEPWVGASPGGSGLGLYQARRVVLAAGGDLRAQPCGTGLGVTLSIPCKKSLLTTCDNPA
jgi:signal transduction histidine kinase